MKDVNATIQNIEEERADLDKQRALMQEVLMLQQKREAINTHLTTLKGKEFTLRKLAEEEPSEVKKQKTLLEAAHTKEEMQKLKQDLEKIESQIAAYDLPDDSFRSFNKYICFSNIRELLKDSSVKIGQIEKEAGCQPGYMSRLDKPANSSEPSVEFLVTAARLLGASLDTLVMVDLAGMTPTEKYLVSFFDKLKADTLEDKLDWNIETSDYLNRMEPDMNGWVEHPLFDVETFYEEGETEYPEEVTRVTFTSNSFGPQTYIESDCYNLRLKNRSVLYLMNISKSVHRVNDPDAFAKEIWMSTPGEGCHLLITNKKASPLVPLVETLFDTVNERMQHPKLKKNLQYVIDAFLQDDVGDDDEDTPFN
mgnify:CR=1 FL=1|jgi:transcriptional regulator with XRE-family HTH domain